MKTETRQVSPLSLRASLSSVNLEKRTVELVWTTGAKVLRSSWFDGQFWEELSVDAAHVRMGRLNNGAPFLANHDGYDVARQLGVVMSARLENGKGTATVRFAKAEDDPEADKVFRKIADGIIQNVSVGYRTYKVEKLEDVEEKIPTLRAVDWEPYEISAVSMGADDGAGFRSAAKTNPVVIVTTRNQEQKMEVPEAVQKERERISGIRSAVKAARLDDSFAERFINDGTEADKARTFVLNELAKRDAEIKTENHISAETSSGITIGDGPADHFGRAVQSAILMRAVPTLVKAAIEAKVPGFSQRTMEEGNRFVGVSLLEIARQSLEARGVITRGMSRQHLAGVALTHRSGPYAGVADFPVLLEDAMNKVLMAAYQTTPDTWSRFCKVEIVPDFRDSPRYRTGSIGTLDSLNENGEFKNKSIPDGAKLSINVQTKGNIIAISRQLIVNDDLSAFSDLGAKLGRAARLSVESDVYALLNANAGLGPTQADTQPWFHSNRGNVNGTGSALGVPGLDADRVIMAAFKDAQNNEFLDIRPMTLLVPSSLGGAARVLNNSQYDVTQSNKFQVPNMVAGLFRDVVDTARLTGTRRYLFADPNVAAAIVVAFLEGAAQSPMVETEAGWRVDGTEMRVRFDYRAQMFDPRGALTNAGA